MRKNILKAVAVTLGLGVCTVAHADNYTSPSKWNNFRPVSDKTAPAAKAVGNKAAAKEAVTEALPAPVPMSSSSHVAAPVHSAPMEMHQPIGSSCAPCQSSPLSQAVSAPWAGSQASYGQSRPSLMPYFGSANLLFFTLEDNSDRYVATGLGSDFSTSLVSPDASTGFDISIGRYLDCNQFGFGLTYMNWDPSSESITRTGTAGTIRASSPAYRDISIDAGLGAESVYDIIDGSGAYAGATGSRLTRDLEFQGIEANLFSFGLMGAQRASYRGCGSNGILGGHLAGLGLGGLGRGRGTTGAAGPLVRTNTGKVRVMTSHGFRWFQAKDSLELAYNIDGAAGYAAADLYENVDVENNLYGYQFGGRLTYCINNRMNLNIGGKFGIYGNDVEMRHRVGTRTAPAYLGTLGNNIDTEDSDTVLATLGELDLGLGYRMSNAWTVRGGYRLMGLSGVATSVDSLPTNYSSVANSGKVSANDSYLIHGGYVGLEYNW